jgi:hypothetical protein
MAAVALEHLSKVERSNAEHLANGLCRTVDQFTFSRMLGQTFASLPNNATRWLV